MYYINHSPLHCCYEGLLLLELLKISAAGCYDCLYVHWWKREREYCQMEGRSNKSYMMVTSDRRQGCKAWVWEEKKHLGFSIAQTSLKDILNLLRTWSCECYIEFRYQSTTTTATTSTTTTETTTILSLSSNTLCLKLWFLRRDFLLAFSSSILHCHIIFITLQPQTCCSLFVAARQCNI